MEAIPSGSADLILTDLPYQITALEWDGLIPLGSMWDQSRRIIRPNGHIVLFSVQPFTTELINSNRRDYRYNWYWRKNNKTGAAFAKVQPMRCIEDICVFRRSQTRDNTGLYQKSREYLQDEKEERKDVEGVAKDTGVNNDFTLLHQRRTVCNTITGKDRQSYCR